MREGELKGFFDCVKYYEIGVKLICSKFLPFIAFFFIVGNNVSKIRMK